MSTSVARILCTVFAWARVVACGCLWLLVVDQKWNSFPQNENPIKNESTKSETGEPSQHPCPQSLSISGSFTCLEVHFYLSRSFGYYMIQIYVPSILTCLISFVSFWIDHRAVPARISVGLLTVLTITTQSSGNSKQCRIKRQLTQTMTKRQHGSCCFEAWVKISLWIIKEYRFF